MKVLIYLLSFLLILTIFSCSNDPCDTINCGPNAICNNATGECICLPGFSGPNCEIQDLCFAKDCTQRGTCDEDTGICDCERGFEGDNCEFTAKDKYLGPWTSFNFTCDGVFIDTTLIIEIEDTPDMFLTRIINLHGQDDTLEMVIVDTVTSLFNIEAQDITVDGVDVTRSGNGSFAMDTTMDVSFTFDTLRIQTITTTDGMTSETCSGLFIRSSIANIPDDPNAVTYTDDILPILTTSCSTSNNQCHSMGTPASGIPLRLYDEVVIEVANNRILGAINQLSGFEPMPRNAQKLNQSDIDLIAAWIDAGTPE